MNKVTKQTEGTVAREEQTANRPCLSPNVNIFETPNEFVLEAEMPGVNKSGLEVTLNGSELTFVGRRSDKLPQASLLHQESKPADFKRVFELDPTIDTGKIAANVEQGVLTLTLPKAEKVKPRLIPVG